MADTALPIGALDPAGALEADDKLEIERGNGGAAEGLHLTGAELSAFVMGMLTADSGVRINTSGGVTTIASGGAAIVEVEASTTLGLQHADRFVRCNSESAMTITVPAQASVDWPDDTQLEGVQWGEGAITFVGESGVTIHRSEKLSATTDGQYSPWGLKRMGVNEWLLFGQLGSA